MPSPSPCDAPFTSPAMSTKASWVGMILAELGDRRELVEARVGDCDLADIGLDRAERIIGRLRRLRLGQRIEKGRLADVRQADDAAFEAHRFIGPENEI